MPPLPVDDVLPLLLTALHSSPAAVLQAPPGAGKTTRVPLALLDLFPLAAGRIVMLEPRRLAATNAARWMAAGLGEEAGQTVGYTIRHERRVSAATRIEIVTEGILARRLQVDPFMEGVGLVIFDEFHERSLDSDLALALCLDVQRAVRDDLKLLVMSATLDPAPVARLLRDAPVVTSAGRSHPVELRYLSGTLPDDPVRATAEAVIRALRETSGDILVFLPGAGEIRRCHRMLAERLDRVSGPLILALYGDLPFAAQEEALLPAKRRKVVLATAIAETSLTIDGVRVVIDSGLSRRLQYDPLSGLNRLVTVRVAAAAAEQRAGRAGRQGPGVCYRLWPEHLQSTLLPYAPPEILTADLAPLALQLAAWGIDDSARLAWLDPPPAAPLAEGRKLLAGLGALDGSGTITPVGRRMAQLPVHPRLACLLLAGKQRGEGTLASDLAALLSERDLLRPMAEGATVATSDSDLLDRLEALNDWRRREGEGTRWPGREPSACRAVERSSRQLRRLLRLTEEEQSRADAGTVASLLLYAYPDRVARQREPGSDGYLLANGRGARLSPWCAVRNRPYLVAVDVDAGAQGEGVIHRASALELAQLRQECPQLIDTRRTVVFDRQRERVTARQEERLGAIVLESRPVDATPDEVAAALQAWLRDEGELTVLPWTAAARQLQSRVRFLARTFPEAGWPELADGALADRLEEWLGPYLGGVRSLADLTRLDLAGILRGLLSREQVRAVDALAPTHLPVPSGSRISLDYPEEGPPVLAVKLQELFGLAETPTVAGGRVMVVLHLLSPARRPIQVTRDLRGFWDGAYREVKRELKGRYPKHPWPDDPWQAVPTAKTVKGSAKR